MSERAVEVEDVYRTYGETTALDGVSISIESGEVFALLGPNGAGKTTLVRAITGTTAIDSGSVALFGTSPDAVSKDRLGVLPQSFTPPERLTAGELVDYYGGLYDRARDTDDVLRTVGMADDADTWYENLSGGQQRRTTLGIALVNDPDLLVLDEPTTGIDPAGRRRVRELIADLADGGTTVLLTTHDIDEAERLADDVAMLADGRVIATGSPATLVADHGGDDRLVVETDVDEVPPTLSPTPDLTDDGLVFAGVSPNDLGRIVDDLDRAGVEYTALRWARPNLEDVYLELTDEWTPARVGRGTIADLDADDDAAQLEAGGEDR